MTLLGIAMTVVVLRRPHSACAGGPAISGTGSSYAALAINQWDAEVASEFEDTVNYPTTSSVIGLNDFANYPQVDFGASEIGYSTGQANSTPPASFQYQYLPDIAGATCLDYNLTSTARSPITTLKLLRLGRHLHRDDHRVGRTSNSGTQSRGAPAQQPIVIVFGRTHPVTTSSSRITWTHCSSLGTRSHPPAPRPDPPPSGRRPPRGPRSGPTISATGLAKTARTTPPIMYTETKDHHLRRDGLRTLHHDPCASVTNSSGANVKPSEAADAIALQNDQLQADLEQNLEPVFTSPQAGAYPISAYSYLIMAEQCEIPAAKQAVEAQYVQFLACDGQEAAGKLGYSPLPPNLVQADFDAIGRITGTQPAAPTASNCPDPYLTGAFNAGGAAGSGPTITTTPVAGSGAAVTPVATTTPAGAAAGAGAASGGAGAGGAGSVCIRPRVQPDRAAAPTATTKNPVCPRPLRRQRCRRPQGRLPVRQCRGHRASCWVFPAPQSSSWWRLCCSSASWRCPLS